MHERKPRVLVTGGAGYLGSTLVAAAAGGRLQRARARYACDTAAIAARRVEPSRLPVPPRRRPRSRDGPRQPRRHRRRRPPRRDRRRSRVRARAGRKRAPSISTRRLQLLELCRERRHVTRFVFASTCSNYGRMADPDVLVDESSALRPLSLYAETKVAFERMLLEQRDASATARGPTTEADRLCATSLRFATIFGVSPRMRFDLTVNEFTCELIVRRHLVVFGEQFWRPYVHVRDAARAIALTLSAPTRSGPRPGVQRRLEPAELPEAADRGADPPQAPRRDRRVRPRRLGPARLSRVVREDPRRGSAFRTTRRSRTAWRKWRGWSGKACCRTRRTPAIGTDLGRNDAAS